MNKSKQLLIAHPPIIGYQYLAYPLAVILNYEECFPWFYCNFIQLKCYKDLYEYMNIDLEYFFNFEFFSGNVYGGIPWLDYKKFDKNIFIMNNINIIQFIINSINQDYYIYTFVDEFYIPHRASYKRVHNSHDILIFGYNCVEKSCNIVGFNEKGIYTDSKVSFFEFNLAFENTDLNDIVILFKKKKEWQYKFDLKHLLEMLTDYLYSKNSSERLRIFSNPETKYVYGMKVYEKLKEYLELVFVKEISYDIRPLYTLWEHKKCMLLRIKYMQDNKYLDSSISIYNDYKNIEQKVQSFRNMMIKYKITGDLNLIKRIITSIDELVEKEHQVLDNILKKFIQDK